ncbi:uncharacterized protein BXIN_1255 [Babesia sp. Xinjiang]|uniref:uncharacterized protein n=1 Tax=Babesia sp. Xinjiang TaxID=462227 RepID=UPI000A241AEF|nr:uncharacterized protein BXIN_1255 [Babesia sp. Xinjiang]ORM39981.1 hypothetical protein BXIN_1255 [Babesia sp. Xinjiang]
MVFGSPYSDTYPKGVWDSLKKSRRGKDIFAPVLSVINASKIYNHVLKYNKGYWLFSIAGGCLSCYALGSACDYVWRRVNKGRLYVDLPYKAPEE